MAALPSMPRCEASCGANLEQDCGAAGAGQAQGHTFWCLLEHPTFKHAGALHRAYSDRGSEQACSPVNIYRAPSGNLATLVALHTSIVVCLLRSNQNLTACFSFPLCDHFAPAISECVFCQWCWRLPPRLLLQLPPLFPSSGKQKDMHCILLPCVLYHAPVSCGALNLLHCTTTSLRYGNCTIFTPSSCAGLLPSCSTLSQTREARMMATEVSWGTLGC